MLVLLSQELLKACGRSHNLSDVSAAITAVKAAGFPSWSLDLISGLPGLDLTGWRHSLEQAIAAQPDHISVYDLQVSPCKCHGHAGLLQDGCKRNLAQRDGLRE